MSCKIIGRIALLVLVFGVGACSDATAPQTCTEPLYTTSGTYGQGPQVTTCQMIVVPCPGSSQHC